MEYSIFLGKILGLYLFITGLGLIIRKERLGKALDDYGSSPALLLFSATLCILFGVFIAVSHSVWTKDWRIFITLLGYASLINGFIGLYFPQFRVEMMKKFSSKLENTLYFSAVSVLLGAFLIYKTFI